MNKIFCGDCLDVMRSMESESVDLVATDTLYNTGRDFGAYEDKMGGGYISWLSERLVECRRLLNKKGSIYLQCDQYESHYIKVAMDGIFGRNRFQNEIIWAYSRWPAKSYRFQRVHDVIFFYTKEEKAIWNHPQESLAKPRARQISYMKEFPDGTRKQTKIRDKNHMVQEKAMGDVWSDITILNGRDNTRTDYPTQKPTELYERIIEASTREGAVVLDPFMGSGTTMVAAKHLGRKYIGIDINEDAVEIAKGRLADVFL